jgi:hypothetical protein
MLDIGAIDILEATYYLGMCGGITVRINVTGRQYRVRHSMQEGMCVSQSDDCGRTWKELGRKTGDELIALLPAGHGWTPQTFVAVWAGFAAGYERGQADAK